MSSDQSQQQQVIMHQQLVFAACKFLDLAVVLSPPEFHMYVSDLITTNCGFVFKCLCSRYEWMFLSDYISSAASTITPSFVPYLDQIAARSSSGLHLVWK